MLTPPIAEKKETLFDEHGNTRVDPYFWMRLSDEQKQSDTPDDQTKQVLDYLEAENAYTENCMAHTKNLQDTLYEEILGRIKKEDQTVPYYFNGYWYYNRFTENSEFPIRCRKKKTLDASEEIILDENELAKPHDFYRVGGLSISPDNRLLAFSEDTLSRNIFTIHFKDLVTGEMLSDTIENTTGTGTWATDNSHFFYTSKNQVTLLSEKIYRHQLGSTQDRDVMVYHEKDPSFYIHVYKSSSQKYIIIAADSTMISDYLILEADNPTGTFKSFTERDAKDHRYSIFHDTDNFVILSNRNAINYKLMITPEYKTDESNWEEVLPPQDEVLLEGMVAFEDYLIVQERKHGLSNFRVISKQSGNIQDRSNDYYIQFAESVYCVYFSMNAEYHTNLLRYTYTSLTTPMSTYDYNVASQKEVLLKREEVIGGHNPNDYCTKRLWAKARDGETIPISLVYKKNFVQDGNAPLLLYGYGSYGMTIDPYFSASRLSLLNRGFTFAIAHVRGGEMKGRSWYENGKLLHKKNTFYDFIDCSQFLIQEKYTSPNHLYAYGASAGGLLIGYIINANPELYNGVIAEVPFVDLISTMWDESLPLTTNEFNEWGNPKLSEFYDYMLSYSPYDNVKAQSYPNILVITGFHDSQVQYWEPAKWVAKLRDQKTDSHRLLFSVDMKAGHGGASGRFKRIRIEALRYAFLLDLEGINE